MSENTKTRVLNASCYLPIRAAIEGMVSLACTASPHANCTTKSSVYSAKFLDQDKLLQLINLLMLAKVSAEQSYM